MNWWKKLTVAALTNWMLAAGCAWLEATFYSDITPDGALVESFFLPLTFLFLVLACGFTIASVAAWWFQGQCA